MPESSALDVLVGLALIFAAFSLAVSRINETVLALFHYRGNRLEAELRALLGSPRPGQATDHPDVTAELLDGPLRVMRTTGRQNTPASVADDPPVGGALASMHRARRLRLPSYLPSTTFAQALLDRVDPPARVMLHQLRPDTLPGDVPADLRAAYRRAYETARRGLDVRAAQALYEAMPADHPTGRVVAAALVSAVGSGPVATLEEGLAALPPSPARTALTAAIVQAGGDREKIVAELARWYDDAMDRLSGWYKRRISAFLLGYAIALSLVFNLDAVSITRALWQDGTVREAAVAAAVSEVTEMTTTEAGEPGAAAGSAETPAGEQGVGAATERTIEAVRDASGLSIPVGWVQADDGRDDPREVPTSASGWLLKIAGIAIACFALTAGAPFWFDLLGRLVNMRSTGPRPRSANA
ncbi:hypothetical protein CC117_24315 [Parafrankia colletiae]|uniref:Uncharacterized protein n=1 Tax=Parafrankia colletiae TaxID=573497 RepID=A0A1S1QIL9_9ACTN|nr:hypothetical protein [Parafrankia colletiae]MCK9901971.1 hypothetical protein [Frankia sp. Cpl3]OHV32912.1 hypothetical protein CC117_24315 [Parafrankia colletiae]